MAKAAFTENPISFQVYHYEKIQRLLSGIGDWKPTDVGFRKRALSMITADEIDCDTTTDQGWMVKDLACARLFGDTETEITWAAHALKWAGEGDNEAVDGLKFSLSGTETDEEAEAVNTIFEVVSLDGTQQLAVVYDPAGEGGWWTLLNNLYVSGEEVIVGGVTFSGTVVFGDDPSDTVEFIAQVDSDLVFVDGDDRTIKTGDDDEGATNQLTLSTGDAGDGNSGNLRITTGTAAGEGSVRGQVVLGANMIPEDEETIGTHDVPFTGGFYGNWAEGGFLDTDLIVNSDATVEDMEDVTLGLYASTDVGDGHIYKWVFKALGSDNSFSLYNQIDSGGRTGIMEFTTSAVTSVVSFLAEQDVVVNSDAAAAVDSNAILDLRAGTGGEPGTLGYYRFLHDGSAQHLILSYFTTVDVPVMEVYPNADIDFQGNLFILNSDAQADVDEDCTLKLIGGNTDGDGHTETWAVVVDGSAKDLLFQYAEDAGALATMVTFFEDGSATFEGTLTADSYDGDWSSGDYTGADLVVNADVTGDADIDGSLAIYGQNSTGDGHTEKWRFLNDGSAKDLIIQYAEDAGAYADLLNIDSTGDVDFAGNDFIFNSDASGDATEDCTLQVWASDDTGDGKVLKWSFEAEGSTSNFLVGYAEDAGPITYALCIHKEDVGVEFYGPIIADYYQGDWAVGNYTGTDLIVNADAEGDADIDGSLAIYGQNSSGDGHTEKWRFLNDGSEITFSLQYAEDAGVYANLVTIEADGDAMFMGNDLFLNYGAAVDEDEDCTLHLYGHNNTGDGHLEKWLIVNDASEKDLLFQYAEDAGVPATVCQMDDDGTFHCTDLVQSGHKNGQSLQTTGLICNVAGEWGSTVDSATPKFILGYLPASITAKKNIFMFPVKVGDEVVGAKLAGVAVETNALTLDARIICVAADGTVSAPACAAGFVQVTAGGAFSQAWSLDAATTVATNTWYGVEILGTTGVDDTISCCACELVVNRK